MKKALAFLMAVVLLFSLTACSQNDLNFYRTMKSMANLDTYSFEGAGTVTINKLDAANAGASEKTKQQLLKIKALFAGNSFLYSGTVDTKNNTMNFHMSVKSSDGKISDLLDMQAKDSFLYLSKDFAASLGDIHTLPIETIDGKTYVKMDMKAIVESMFSRFAQNKSGTSDTADLSQIKQSMMNKANAVALIQMFKTVVLKGTDLASSDLLDGFSADLVKKVSDSKYSLHLGNEEISAVLAKLVVYLGGNQEKVKNFEVKYIQSLTDEELVMIGINPTNKDKIIAELQNQKTDTLPATVATAGKSQKSSSSQSALVDTSLLSSLNIGYDLSVEKTGSTSYDLSESASLKTKPEASKELGMNFDIAFSNTLNVNSTAKGDIQAKAEVSSIQADSASVKLTISDANVAECGLLFSSASDLTNGKKIAGVKQSDGTYAVSLSGLNGNTTYYYKVYTTDASGNQVLSGDVKSFKTSEASANTTTKSSEVTGNQTTVTTTTSGETTNTTTGTQTSPATGDSSSAFPSLLVLCGAAVSLSLLKSKQKA